MERFYALVEQLDLAITELEGGTPSRARFALIMIDNSVELVLHSKCEHEVSMDRYRATFTEAKYDEKTWEKAVGQDFGEKVKFCRNLGLIDDELAQTIRISHSYRNELYHVGIRHDPIILPLAWEYFRTACALLPHLSFPMWKLEDPTSERVRRYVDTDGFLGVQPSDFQTVADRLLSARAALPVESKKLLSQFAVEVVDRVDHNLEFLVADNFEGWVEAKVLEEVQFHHYLWRDEGAPRLDPTAYTSLPEFENARNEIREEWTPRYHDSPVERWRRRARAIETSRSWHLALQRFQQLRAEMKYLEDVLNEAAAELDAAIQLEIDRRLGK
jgi:hypothetical protein